MKQENYFNGEIIGLISKYIFGSNEDAGQVVANWHNRREYPEDDNLDDVNSDSINKNQSRFKENMTKDNSMDPDELDYEPTNLKLVIILSGKRKSGKDHISTLITNYIGHERIHHLAVLRIAGPIKKEFSRNNKLDFMRLLDSSEYKENFRLAMVNWSETYREKVGWNCFLKQAIKEQKAKDKLIWILNDARRLCDLEYFESDPCFSNTTVIKLRIEASEDARMSRGWKFVEGIDDRDTECGLDLYDEWTHVIENDYNDEKQLLAEQLKPIFEEIDKALEDV